MSLLFFMTCSSRAALMYLPVVVCSLWAQLGEEGSSVFLGKYY